MIFVYFQEQNNVLCRVLGANENISAEAIWVDVRNPDETDIGIIENQLNIKIPSEHEIWKNHVLNRFYIEDDKAYMTAALITKVDSPHPGTASVTFVLAPKFLLTVHDIDPTSFRNFTARLVNSNEVFPSSHHVLEGLLEEMITRVAYNSEIVVETLDDISHNIFGNEDGGKKGKSASQKMKTILRRLGAVADLNSKINESLHSFNRMLVFFKQIVAADTQVHARADILTTDVNALSTQTAFLSDKITFQLDALLGMINVEQNLIIKIFSVVAVFFMPPTLVSSIYGMNFQHMPELNLTYGYPVAIFLMFFSALIPFLYFKRKGWL